MDADIFGQDRESSEIHTAYRLVQLLRKSNYTYLGRQYKGVEETHFLLDFFSVARAKKKS